MDPTVLRWLTVAAPDSPAMATIRPDDVTAAGDILRVLQDEASATHRLQIGAAIGHGGMADVRSGTQRLLSREVAVKALREPATPAAERNLLHEAMITGALEHPNIVPVHDVSVDGSGRPVVVMRRIDGTNWRTLIEDPARVEESFHPQDLLEWHLRVFLQVCNAVHHAHSRGVIHRDIKPENVMIGAFGEVYLLDWGIAMAKRGPLAEKLKPVASVQLAGTASYLAPEMLKGSVDEIDEQSDVYLLGATLFHVATGRPPHRGHNVLETLANVSKRRVSIPESLPAELRAVLARALAHAKSDRYRSAEDLKRAIEALLAHRSSTKLSAEASTKLTELEEVRSKIDAHDSDWWKKLYRVHSECRHGFHAALKLWADNDEARDGIRRAAAKVIDAELAHGTPQAAMAILAELEDPPLELAERVHRAQLHHDRRQVQISRMASMARNLSPASERLHRSVTLMILGVAFALQAAFSSPTDHVEHVVGNLLALLCMWVYVLSFGRRLLRTSFNRRVLVAMSIFIFLDMVVRALNAFADTPLEQIIGQTALMLVTLVLVAGITFHRAFLLLVLPYGVSYVIAVLRPDVFVPSMVIAHLVAAVYMGFLWVPQQSKNNDEMSSHEFELPKRK